jgi:hypothetical protein
MAPSALSTLTGTVGNSPEKRPNRFRKAVDSKLVEMGTVPSFREKRPATARAKGSGWCSTKNRMVAWSEAPN